MGLLVINNLGSMVIDVKRVLMMNKNFKVLTSYIIGMLLVLLTAIYMFGKFKIYFYILLLIFVLMLLQLFFGSKMASWASDFLIRYQ